MQCAENKLAGMSIAMTAKEVVLRKLPIDANGSCLGPHRKRARRTPITQATDPGSSCHPRPLAQGFAVLHFMSRSHHAKLQAAGFDHASFYPQDSSCETSTCQGGCVRSGSQLKKNTQGARIITTAISHARKSHVSNMMQSTRHDDEETNKHSKINSCMASHCHVPGTTYIKDTADSSRKIVSSSVVEVATNKQNRQAMWERGPTSAEGTIGARTAFVLQCSGIAEVGDRAYLLSSLLLL